ncbi:hypothetical protein C922_05837 [Plasmodium inui San Antonio 1]|uniref:Uncharacterized protein n=1 Tax=Plasmodium inui San Antonio 1 TaxID=1237626 RepID=W7A3X6_9APIC|nr:hypothetical protein C922_05837 [Plasmodium inui San Antonio 1]EUD63784.1 hypothetical protein C922_05837 [Plasmodium inui San Antonio 1]
MTNRNLDGQEPPSSTTGKVLIGRTGKGPVGTVKWKSIPKGRTSIKGHRNKSNPCRGSDRRPPPASQVKGPKQSPTEVETKEAEPPEIESVTSTTVRSYLIQVE